MSDKNLLVVEHLEELRSRIIKSFIVIVVFSLISYKYVDRIIYWLLRPIGKVVFTAPEEAFLAKLEIAFFCGLFLSLPLLLYQFWKFISSALNSDEKKYIFIFGLLSFIFFIVGAIFGYIVVVPIGIKFLLSFANDSILPMITVSKYISFVTTFTFSFGLVFELPLIILFLTKIGLVSPVYFTKRRREAIVIIFIIAAILTPPDVASQFLMAVPLLVLYEISIIFSKFVYRKKEILG